MWARAMEDGVRGPPEPIMKIETRTAASLREAFRKIPRNQRDANQQFPRCALWPKAVITIRVVQEPEAR